jgi:hypothetical protein
MTKNEVFEKIKNDKTIIYGEPIFNVFLKTVNFLETNHLLDLSEKERDLLSPSCIFNLLDFPIHYDEYSEEDKNKIVDAIGRRINFLSDDLVVRLFYDPSIITGAMKYKNDLNDYVICGMIYNAKDPEEVAKKIGEKNLNKLSSKSIFLLISSSLPQLSHSLHDTENSSYFQKILNAIGNQIYKLDDDSICRIIANSIIRGAHYKFFEFKQRLEELRNLFGQKIINSLSSNSIKEILKESIKENFTTNDFINFIFVFLGKNNINKLGEKELNPESPQSIFGIKFPGFLRNPEVQEKLKKSRFIRVNPKLFDLLIEYHDNKKLLQKLKSYYEELIKNDNKK